MLERDVNSLIKRLVDEAPPLNMDQRLRLAVLLAAPMGPPETPAEPKTPETALLLTAEEAAKALGCGRTTIYQLLFNGELPSVHVGRLRRIAYSDLVSYIKRAAQ